MNERRKIDVKSISEMKMGRTARAEARVFRRRGIAMVSSQNLLDDLQR